MKLRLMTANLWHRRTDPDALAELLEGVAPDVLAGKIRGRLVVDVNR